MLSKKEMVWSWKLVLLWDSLKNNRHQATGHVHEINTVLWIVLILISVCSKETISEEKGGCIMWSEGGCTSYTHRSKWSFWAKSCQSLPLALAVSKVAQILWRMDKGILKALGPVWDVTVQSVCIKNGTDSFSFWRKRREIDNNQEGVREDLQTCVLVLSSLLIQMGGVYWGQLRQVCWTFQDICT